MTQEIPFPKPMPDLFNKVLAENRNNDKTYLSKLVTDYLKFAKKSLSINEFIDIDSATLLTGVSHYLISQLDNLSQEEKSYAVAAIYYFVECDDREHDFNSMFGFEDDIEVMNYVLEKIGHTNKKIEL